MSNIRENIFDYFAEREVDDVPILDPEGLDTAIVGVTENQIVYSYEKLVEAYMNEFREDGMDEEEVEEQAIEWISYNTMRSLPYMGENAPIIMYPLDSF
jgi:hypothetical protein